MGASVGAGSGSKGGAQEIAPISRLTFKLKITLITSLCQMVGSGYFLLGVKTQT